LPEPTPLLPDFSIPVIPTEQNKQNSCPWEELEQKCDEKMKKYSQYFRPNPMIISMRMEARIQLEYKKLGLPDDGRPGSRLLERYVNQYGDNAHEAFRDIKKLLGTSKSYIFSINSVYFFLMTNVIFINRLLIKYLQFGIIY